LTEAYKPQFYFWEAIECIRRLLLASVVGIISKDQVVAPVLGLVFSLAFTFLFTAYRPFQNADDSTLCIILSNAVSVFFLAALIVLAGFIGEDDAKSQSSFGIILIVVILLGPLFILIRSVSGNMKMIVAAAFCHKKKKGSKQPTADLATENTATTESAGKDESAAANDLPPVVGGTTSKSFLVEGSEGFAESETRPMLLRGKSPRPSSRFEVVSTTEEDQEKEAKAGREESKSHKVPSTQIGRSSHLSSSRTSSSVAPALQSPRASKSFSVATNSGYISRASSSSLSSSRSGHMSSAARSKSSSPSHFGEIDSAGMMATPSKSSGAEDGNIAQGSSSALQTGYEAAGGPDEKEKGVQILVDATATEDYVRYV